MPLDDFRSVFMPYCLDQQEDGRYAILNREYKPVGFFTRDHVRYEDHPVLVTLKDLGPKKIEKLSCHADPNPKRIYLYNDGCVPTHDKKHMKSYMEKLAILASLKTS